MENMSHFNPSEIFSPKPKLLAVTDVIEMLNSVNKYLAGREVTLTQYLDYIEKRHGSEPIAYITHRYSTMERMMDFISLNSQQQFQVERTQHGRLRIGGRSLKPEQANGDSVSFYKRNVNCTNGSTTNNSACSNTTQNRSITTNQQTQYNFLEDIPYSTAFQCTMLPIGHEYEAIVGLFRAGRELRFSFTTEFEQKSRDQLLNKLNNENSLKQARIPDHLYKGMPCLALNDGTSEGSHLYHRAVVVQVASDKVELYFVDCGLTFYRDVSNVREIPVFALNENVYSHPAIIGLVKPPNQLDNFPKCVEQHLSVYDEDHVSIRIIRHAVPYHEVELKELVDPLIEQGLIDRDISCKSSKKPIDEQRNALYTIQVEMLPNMNNIFIVTLSEEEGGKVLVPTACLSALFGLGSDSLLADLQRATDITVSMVHQFREDINDKLYRDLTELECPLLIPDQTITLISIASVVSLLKASEAAFSLSLFLPCSSSTYKHLRRILRPHLTLVASCRNKAEWKESVISIYR